MLLQERIDIVFRALSPISQGQEVMGNHGLIKTRKIRRVGGGFVNIPEVTGNAMRNGLRRASAYAIIREAGLDGQLSDAAIRLLFSGGAVTGRGDASQINLDSYRELCDLVPPLALFGGCSDSHPHKSKLAASPLTLICKETYDHLPPWVREWLAEQKESFDAARTHITVENRVQMPVLTDDTMRPLLTAAAQVDINKRLAAREQAHEGDEPGEKMGPRPYSFEAVCEGSLWAWNVSYTVHSELEKDTAHAILTDALFVNAPFRVGGKIREGFGKLEVRKGWNLRPISVEQEATDMHSMVVRKGVGDLFRAHVRERKDRIREFLTRVNA